MEKCKICGASFKSINALSAHMGTHSNKKRHMPKCCCLLDRKVITACHLDNYIRRITPSNKCLECGCLTKNLKFCNRSCNAIYANRKRADSGWMLSKESKLKISKSVKNNLALMSTDEYQEYIKKIHPNQEIKSLKSDEVRKAKLPKPEIIGEYTKVYFMTCKISGKLFVSTTVKHICPELKDTRCNYANSCKFKFSASKYIIWFNTFIQLIDEYGWYSTPGSSKLGKTNICGISRDHLYSVNDGWLNNIDPKIIRHPANCQFIPHKENQKKGKHSTITIEELYKRIRSFEAIYGVYFDN